MSWTIDGSGNFIEDFFYGNPYDDKIAPHPPEFMYSTSPTTTKGEIKSTSYRRKDFRLQFQNRKLNKFNNDKGLNGGAMTTNGYYFMFPILGWGEVQALTLKLHLSAPGTLTYHRSWDGHINDIHYLVVNDKEHENVSNTAGHAWTKSTVDLPAGHVRIVWAVEATQPPSSRNGVSDKTGNGPVLNRYFRLANIQITNVSWLEVPTHSYCDTVVNGTASAHGRLTMVEKFKHIPTAEWLIYHSDRSGPIPLFADSFFIPDLSDVITAKATLLADGELAGSGRLTSVHSSDDGGVTLNNSGDLTVYRPIDTLQTIQDLIRPIVSTIITMETPVICNGLPILPAYLDVQISSLSSAGTYSSNPAVDPSSADHALPHAATYSWVSVDITGGLDAPVYTWPERHSGPSFQSQDPVAPTIAPHVHFNEANLSYTDYVQVITFYWRWCQHMWVDLGSSNPPFTWSFTGIFFPSHKKQWQHILSAGYKIPLGDDEQNDVQDGISGKVNDEATSTGNSFFGIYENGAVLNSVNNNKVFINGNIDWRPAVYTIVYTSSNTYLYARHRSHKWSHHSGVNNLASDGRFLLGRESGFLGETYGAHMSLMEVNYWNRALSANEVEENEDYLMGVYKFEQYL